MLPNVENRTLAIRSPRIANVAQVALHKLFSTSIVNIAPTCPCLLHGEPKFHSWGRCTIALTTMHSDLRFNLSLACMCINLVILYYITWILFASWGVIGCVT